MEYRIVNADCRDALPDIGLRSVAHIVTDPPYERQAHVHQRRVLPSGDVSREPLSFDHITNDLRRFVCREAKRVCTGWFLAFCQVEAVAAWRAEMIHARVRYRRALVWVKPDAMPQFTGDGPGQGYECCAVGYCGRGRSEWNGAGRNGVFTFNKNSGGKHLHETQKPLDLMLELVRLFTSPGDLVCDPFCGSGTTGVACRMLGRRFVGIEKNPEMAKIAEDRVAGALSPQTFRGSRLLAAPLFDGVSHDVSTTPQPGALDDGSGGL